MGNKLVIIGASDLQLPLIEKAKEKGFETFVFAWKSGDKGEKVADHFYPISIVEKELILEECKKIKPTGIVSIASDLAVLTVNYIAENLGLIGNSMYSSIISTNKYEMRRVLSENINIKCPRFIKIKSIDDIKKVDLSYPLIMKPVDRSGSRGVFKVENKDDIYKYYQFSKDESFVKETIIEEFITGEEFSVEYISQNGVHTFLAVTRKITTGSPNFIEIGHIQTANISSELEGKIRKAVEEGLDSLEIKNGASHSEIILTKNEEIYIVEIGSRMGGDCIGSDLVPISTGYDFLGNVINIACNKKIMKKEDKDNNKIGVVRYIFNEEDYRNINSLDESYIVRKSDIILNEGIIIKDSSERAGFYVLAFDNNDDYMKIINKIFYL